MWEVYEHALQLKVLKSCSGDIALSRTGRALLKSLENLNEFINKIPETKEEAWRNAYTAYPETSLSNWRVTTETEVYEPDEYFKITVFGWKTELCLTRKDNRIKDRVEILFGFSQFDKKWWFTTGVNRREFDTLSVVNN
jgi:hypothetical protein